MASVRRDAIAPMPASINNCDVGAVGQTRYHWVLGEGWIQDHGIALFAPLPRTRQSGSFRHPHGSSPMGGSSPIGGELPPTPRSIWDISCFAATLYGPCHRRHTTFCPRERGRRSPRLANLPTAAILCPVAGRSPHPRKGRQDPPGLESGRLPARSGHRSRDTSRSCHWASHDRRRKTDSTAFLLHSTSTARTK